MNLAIVDVSTGIGPMMVAIDVDTAGQLPPRGVVGQTDEQAASPVACFGTLP